MTSERDQSRHQGEILHVRVKSALKESEEPRGWTEPEVQYTAVNAHHWEVTYSPSGCFGKLLLHHCLTHTNLYTTALLQV